MGMLDPESDNVLIRRAVEGDAAALEKLFRRHYATIYAFAQKICGDPVLAEDVAQDSVVKLMGSIRTFDGRCAFTSWLYRVVLTKALDHRRKEKRRGLLAEEYRQVMREVRAAAAGDDRDGPPALGPDPRAARRRARRPRFSS